MRPIVKWAAWCVACAAIPCMAETTISNVALPRGPDNPPPDAASGAASHHSGGYSTARTAGAVQDARQQVSKAARVLAKMKQDPQASRLLHQAKGILILPDYGRGALVVGGGGGPGVLVLRRNGQWAGPALYNVGMVSIGAQAGGAGGSAAMLLMSDKAVRQFEQENDFALDADAGITVWNASARGHGRTGGDIAMWTDTKGLYAGASVGLTDINFDEHETAALYGRSVTPREVLSGHSRTAQAAAALMQELPQA